MEEKHLEEEEKCDFEEAEVDTELSSGDGSFFSSEFDSSFGGLSSHLIGVRFGVAPENLMLIRVI